MTSTLFPPPPLTDATNRLLVLLEQHQTCPDLAAELQQQRGLARLLDEHRQRGEEILAAWRTAVSHRWECEVAAQRAFMLAQRQLKTHYEADPARAQLLVPAQRTGSSTPGDLLVEVRRLAASLELLSPPPPFARAAIADLLATSNELELALGETTRLEAQRRALLAEQRIAINFYTQAYNRARGVVTSCIGEHELPPITDDGYNI